MEVVELVAAGQRAVEDQAFPVQTFTIKIVQLIIPGAVRKRFVGGIGYSGRNPGFHLPVDVGYRIPDLVTGNKAENRRERQAVGPPGQVVVAHKHTISSTSEVVVALVPPLIKVTIG